MEKGDIILVEFTGREARSRDIFDTTDEKLAKMAGIHRDNAKYGAVPVVVGKGDLLRGLDSALRGMRVGEKKTVTLPPENAFGPRRRELIAVVPMREFQKRKMRPVPGLVVDVNGNYGKVQTVSGGRVRVDFNLALAGKEVVYDVKVVKRVDAPGKKVDVLFEKYLPLKNAKCRLVLKQKRVVVTVPKGLPPELKAIEDKFSEIVKESVPEVEKVDFETGEAVKGEAEGEGEAVKAAAGGEGGETAEKGAGEKEGKGEEKEAGESGGETAGENKEESKAPETTEGKTENAGNGEAGTAEKTGD